jgi:hypothetical protein
LSSTPPGIACAPTCSAEFEDGTLVQLHAEASPPSIFEGWSGACTGSSSDCALTVTSALSVTATFALPKWTLTVAVSGAGALVSTPAGIDCPGTCSAQFPEGASVTLEALPEGDGWLSSWSGDCQGRAWGRACCR